MWLLLFLDYESPIEFELELQAGFDRDQVGFRASLGIELSRDDARISPR